MAIVYFISAHPPLLNFNVHVHTHGYAYMGGIVLLHLRRCKLRGYIEDKKIIQGSFGYKPNEYYVKSGCSYCMIRTCTQLLKNGAKNSAC